MKVLLVGREFDFSSGDGISRYSHEIYAEMRKHASVRALAMGERPRPIRAFVPVSANNCDIVHLMYPDVARVRKKDAKMVTMWHDLRLFTKYADVRHARYKPRFVERYGVASRVFIRRWATANYLGSDAIVANCTKTLEEVKTHFKKQGIYESGKVYKAIPLGLPSEYLNAKTWEGERKDFAYVGSIHLRHKNLDGLLKVFDRISRSDERVKLHIFTSSPNAKGLLREKLRRFENLSKINVVLHYRTPDEEVSRYLQKAVACLHLTLEEGFGMPILEATALGTQVIVLKSSSISPEVTRYAIKVNENKVTTAALRLMANSASASRAAVAYARSFTWRKTAEETLKVYKKVLS